MYDDIIESAAKEYVIDPDLIRAFIKTESSWDPNAYRYEPTIKDASYGLMQILLGTAKSVSGNDSLTSADLYDPAKNIVIGAQYLRQLFNKWPYLNDAIAAYNAGSPRMLIPGIYINQGYVTKVNANYMFYKAGFIAFAAAAVVGGVIWWKYRRRA